MLTINIHFKDILRKLWIASIAMLCSALYHTGILKIFCRKFFQHRICVVMCHGIIDDVKRQAEDRFHMKASAFKKFYSLLRQVCPLVTAQDLEGIIDGEQTNGGVLISFDEAHSEWTHVLPMLIEDGCGIILFPVQLATEDGFFWPKTLIRLLRNPVCLKEASSYLGLASNASAEEVISRLHSGQRNERGLCHHLVGVVSNGNAVHPKDRVMSWQELRTMSSLGVTIGSHSVSHRNLCAIPESEVIEESEQSKDFFESICGKKLIWFAYPGGSHNSRILMIVSEAGYRFAVIATPGFVTPNTNPLEIPRVDVYAEADSAFFSLARVCGLESIFRSKFYGMTD